MKNLDEIIKSLLESAIRITEKIEENSSIDYACVNYFYDSEALDMSVFLKMGIGNDLESFSIGLDIMTR